ncbi:MAG TPA: tetratricopeptide repeat protein [Actinomycetota bacterium]
MKRSGLPRLLSIAIVVTTLAATACGSDVDPDQALAEGLAQQQAGNAEAAAAKYQQVLDVRPDDKYANYNLGVLEQAEGRTELAEGYYRAALDADPNFQPALFNLAIVRTSAGATQEAVDLYLRVIALDPQNASAHFNVGILLREAGQAKDATTHLNEALELEPSLAGRLLTEPVPPGDQQDVSGSGSSRSPSPTG